MNGERLLETNVDLVSLWPPHHTGHPFGMPNSYPFNSIEAWIPANTKAVERTPCCLIK